MNSNFAEQAIVITQNSCNMEPALQHVAHQDVSYPKVQLQFACREQRKRQYPVERLHVETMILNAKSL